MDLTYDSEQLALRDAARVVAGKFAPSRARDEVHVGPGRHDPQLWSALAELGALGLPFAETAGGFGASPVEVSLVAGELGRAGVLAAYAEAMVAGSLLAQSDSSLLGDVVAGERLVVPAIAEPGHAWGPDESGVLAMPDGDGWSLSGDKGTPLYAVSADAVVTTATTPAGLAVFLVDGPFDKGQVRFDNAPGTMLLSPAEAPAALDRALSLGLVTLLGEAVGAMEVAVAMTADYLKTRKQFGVPLMTFQALTHRAADMYVSLELARSASQFAAISAAEDPDDWATVARARVVVGQSGRHIGQEAIQLHGGIGMTAEYAVGHLTARLTAIEHTLGDTRWHLARLAGTIGDHEQVDVLG